MANEDVDGIIIGGHVFSWGKNWVSVFLQKLNKPFLIDPMTYVFAKDPSFILREGSMRKSYEGLVDWIDWKLSDIAGKRPLRPDDFEDGEDEKTIEDFVTKVLEFQSNITKLSDNLQTSLEKYSKIMGENLVKDSVSPQFFLSPYFHATDERDLWYNLTVECMRIASKLEEYKPIVPVLCVSESFIINPDGRRQICKDLSEFDICALWISGLNEYSSSLESLAALKRLVEKLAENGVSTINMYGGYLSLLLHSSGIAVTCCGPGYGESKKADQIATGGGFPDRYYIPDAKFTVVEANARVFIEKNPQFLCDCPTCKGISKSLGLTPESKDYVQQLDNFFQEMRGTWAQVHYINCKARESARIEEVDADTFQDELTSFKSKLDDAGSVAFEVPSNHLSRWASLFSTSGL